MILKKFKLLLFLLFITVINGFACRFTIRDIGYSRINQQNYLVSFKGDTLKYAYLLRDFKKLAYTYSFTSNTNYEISHQTNLPARLECLNSSGDFIFSKSIDRGDDIRSFYNSLLFSPLQQMMYNNINEVFAFVVAFSSDGNDKSGILIDKVLMQFDIISPNLDKEIHENIMKIIIPSKKWSKEKVVLRSLGIKPDSSQSVIAVFYGRGRLADKPLTGSNISADRLLNQLVILGTDCECGIDLSPLLHNAIPLNWDKRISQLTADMLGFDVENPLILIEMGQILSKEPIETGKSKFLFAPQTIDLDRVLGKGDKSKEMIAAKVEQESGLRSSIITVIAIALVIILSGIFIYLKQKN